MTREDARVFRPHLNGDDLFRAQERLIAALMRRPALVPRVRLANLGREDFSPELAPLFDFAIRGDRDQVRAAILNGHDDVRRLCLLGVELGHGQALDLARQIKESNARNRLAVAPAWARGNDLDQADADATEPDVDRSRRRASPKRVSERTKAVVKFLRNALAEGPLSAKVLRRYAIDAGLLREGSRIGSSSTFRNARSILGIKTYRRTGRPSPIWALPVRLPCGAADIVAPLVAEPDCHEQELCITLEEAIEWILRVKFFRDAASWGPDWGPSPDYPGCLAPPDILRAYGYRG
jgi:hypothetical protein